MTHALVASWTAYIKELQQWAKKPHRDKPAPSVLERCEKLGLAPTSPLLSNAVLKRLMYDVQVTRKLAALYVQAYQQSTAGSVKAAVASVLGLWLHKVVEECHVSQGSRIAASLQQQLQESGLLQHMPAILQGAADGLEVAAAAAAASGLPALGSSSDSSGAQQSVAAALSAGNSLGTALVLAGKLLDVHRLASCVFATTSDFSLETALPAAPAAVRLILRIFQTSSKVQQLAREGSPAAALLLVGATSTGDTEDWRGASLLAAARATVEMAAAVTNNLLPSSLQSLAGARELLLCPELMPCIANSAIKVLFGLNTKAEGAAGSGREARDEVRQTSSSRSTTGGGSNDAGMLSGMGRQALQAQGASQQQVALAAGSSAQLHQASSSSVISHSSHERLSNGVSLEGLTSLSSSLFGLLGVDKSALLQATHCAVQFPLETFYCVNSASGGVLIAQVEQLSTPCGACNAHLLQQFELHMLLGLVMHQLTASIPADYPMAQDVRAAACQPEGGCPLLQLFTKVNPHNLPLPTDYMGPQVALHVVPSSVRPPLPSSSLLEQQQQQQPQWYTVAPSAQLLAELLPLLNTYCQTQLQQQDMRVQQQMEVLEQQLQQAHRVGQAAGPQRIRVSADFVSFVETVTSSSLPESVQCCVKHICALLFCAVVPSPDLTTAEVQAAVSAASTQDFTPGQVHYSCVICAPDVIAENARGILRLFEALLRHAAAWSNTMTQLQNDERLAAAAPTAKQLTADGVQRADDVLSYMASCVADAIGHVVIGAFPHSPSALALAALSAGPGSKVKRQLLSLLSTMVKLGDTIVGAADEEQGGDQQRETEDQQEAEEVLLGEDSETAGVILSYCAAITAAALLQGGVGNDPVRVDPGAKGAPQPGSTRAVDGDSHADASLMLTSMLVIGRHHLRQARQLQSVAGSAKYLKTLGTQIKVQHDPFVAELYLPAVQHLLQASSTQEQLVAAGYAPQARALPQQLQQVLAAMQAVRDSVVDEQPDSSYGKMKVSLLETAKQLQAAGMGMCSFAVPSMCNNSSCANIFGHTELGLVSGRSCICAGCGVARYCGRACQRSAWKQHKPVCAALAAAAATSKAAAVSAVAGRPTGP